MRDLRWAGAGLVMLAVVVSAARASADTTAPEPAAKRAFYATKFTRRPAVRELTALGRALFFDPSLSATGKLACATCHDPARAYGPANDRAFQLGGVDGKQGGVRAVPSLRYLQTVPRFDEHYHDSDGDNGVDQGPAGGFTWDGRAQTAHDQARLPLFSPLEMANAGPEALIARLRGAPAGARLREAFGADVLDGPDRGLVAVLLALEAFEQSPADFYPYDSKYDAYLRGQVALGAAESRGLALFNDPRKGNCASCHPSAIKEGAFPQFTDFGFVALGVPRNRRSAAGLTDLGLCGPFRTDLADRPDTCGKFRAPTLRNVALKRRFMHNGVFTRLDDVVRFYAERDTSPERFYARGADGKILIYDDLPPRYRGNVNQDPPFGRKPGDAPALSAAEIADVVAFLSTLTDGYAVTRRY